MSKFFDQEVEQFFGQLVKASGISGNIQPVSELLKKRLQGSPAKIAPDPEGLGIFEAVINPDLPFSVMLQSHMDVVGLRVNHVDDQGFVYLRPVGGIDVLSLKGTRVLIETKDGPVKGLIQGKPIHHTEKEERTKVKLEHLFIRTEFTGKSDSPIRVGDPIVFSEPMDSLGEEFLVGPGFDNRLGVLLMVEMVRRLPVAKLKVALHAVASCGEEIGCRGIRAVAQQLKPNLAIVVDVTNVTDYPGASHKRFGKQNLGEGPLLVRGYNTRNRYNELMMKTAEDCGIPYQIRAEDITATDGREIDEAGVPTIVIRVPGSMLHTPNDCVSRMDIELTARLIEEFLLRLPFD